MKLHVLEFQSDSDDLARVKVEMELAEVVYLVKLLGSVTSRDAEAVLPNGDAINHAVYDVLDQALIMAYPDNGVDDAAAAL